MHRAPEAGLGHQCPAALHTPDLLGLAPSSTSRTQCSSNPVPSVSPCCDGGHAEQGEGTSPRENPTRCWGTEGWSGRNRLLPCSPPSCLSLAFPWGAGWPPMLPITLLAHYWHKKEASTGMVNLNSAGSGVQETCSGVYQPLQSQNRKPPQPEIAAGMAAEGLTSTAALPWLLRPCRKSSWSQGNRADP